MHVTLLGTGTSHGVPTLDCMLSGYARCPRDVCRKARYDPRYRRTRASVLLEVGAMRLLFDTSQDFRTQMLDNAVSRIDAVLYTHGHADHIYGLPDIRSYCHAKGGPMDVYGSRETLGSIEQAFDYVFHPPENAGGGIPALRTHVLEGISVVCGVPVTPIPVQHGALRGCQGYRVGGLAYIPDVKVIPEPSLALLEGLDLLILNCLRIRPHSTHLSLEESLHYAERLHPRRCVLTHMAHDIDADVDGEGLPEWVRFGYDGLTLSVQEDGNPTSSSNSTA
ncbi:MAG: MBL fold metallo-hydrolase [Anaerolineae bacterium]